MPNFFFERECRTPSSECYTIMDSGAAVGRLDLHFTRLMVHGTLVVSESLTQESIQELVEMIDEDVLDAVGIEREEFIVHVHQGRDLGVYSNQDFRPDGNGHPPTGA
ncbi:MAG: hypothetical protein IIB28_05010 [Chloroflexi bacterium]|nr:hypothetical protein [Chloroflexota bacterium]